MDDSESDPARCIRFICPVCLMHTATKELFVSHISVTHAAEARRELLNSDSGIFDPNDYTFRFSGISLAYVGNDGLHRFLCDFCEEAAGTFLYEDGIEHLLRHHSVSSCLNICFECRKVFATPEETTSHLRGHGTVAGGAMSCSICDTQFQDESPFSTHMDEHVEFTEMEPESNSEWFVCSHGECRSGFPEHAGLRIHTRHIHAPPPVSVPPPSVSVPQLPKAVSTPAPRRPSGPRRPMGIRSPLSHQCPLCGAECVTLARLLAHCFLQHETLFRRRFMCVCRLCHDITFSTVLMQKHAMAEHAWDSNTTADFWTERSFWCEPCRERFGQARDLLFHIYSKEHWDELRTVPFDEAKWSLYGLARATYVPVSALKMPGLANAIAKKRVNKARRTKPPQHAADVRSAKSSDTTAPVHPAFTDPRDGIPGGSSGDAAEATFVTSTAVHSADSPVITVTARSLPKPRHRSSEPKPLYSSDESPSRPFISSLLQSAEPWNNNASLLESGIVPIADPCRFKQLPPLPPISSSIPSSGSVSTSSSQPPSKTDTPSAGASHTPGGSVDDPVSQVQQPNGPSSLLQRLENESGGPTVPAAAVVNPSVGKPGPAAFTLKRDMLDTLRSRLFNKVKPAPKTARSTPPPAPSKAQALELVKCRRCSAEFASFNKLAEHFSREHKAEGDEKLALSLRRWENLDLRLLSRLGKHSALLKCQHTGCSMTHRDVTAMCLHFKRAHYDAFRLPCCVCASLLDSPQLIRDHMVSHALELDSKVLKGVTKAYLELLAGSATAAAEKQQVASAVPKIKVEAPSPTKETSVTSQSALKLKDRSENEKSNAAARKSASAHQLLKKKDQRGGNGKPPTPTRTLSLLNSPPPAAHKKKREDSGSTVQMGDRTTEPSKRKRNRSVDSQSSSTSPSKRVMTNGFRDDPAASSIQANVKKRGRPSKDRSQSNNRDGSAMNGDASVALAPAESPAKILVVDKAARKRSQSRDSSIAAMEVDSAAVEEPARRKKRDEEKSEEERGTCSLCLHEMPVSRLPRHLQKTHSVTLPSVRKKMAEAMCELAAKGRTVDDPRKPTISRDDVADSLCLAFTKDLGSDSRSFCLFCQDEFFSRCSLADHILASRHAFVVPKTNGPNSRKPLSSFKESTAPKNSSRSHSSQQQQQPHRRIIENSIPNTTGGIPSSVEVNDRTESSNRDGSAVGSDKHRIPSGRSRDVSADRPEPMEVDTDGTGAADSTKHTNSTQSSVPPVPGQHSTSTDTPEPQGAATSDTLGLSTSDSDSDSTLILASSVVPSFGVPHPVEKVGEPVRDAAPVEGVLLDCASVSKAVSAVSSSSYSEVPKELCSDRGGNESTFASDREKEEFPSSDSRKSSTLPSVETSCTSSSPSEECADVPSNGVGEGVGTHPGIFGDSFDALRASIPASAELRKPVAPTGEPDSRKTDVSVSSLPVSQPIPKIHATARKEQGVKLADSQLTTVTVSPSSTGSCAARASKPVGKSSPVAAEVRSTAVKKVKSLKGSHSKVKSVSDFIPTSVPVEGGQPSLTVPVEASGAGRKSPSVSSQLTRLSSQLSTTASESSVPSSPRVSIRIPTHVTSSCSGSSSVSSSSSSSRSSTPSPRPGPPVAVVRNAARTGIIVRTSSIGQYHCALCKLNLTSSHSARQSHFESLHMPLEYFVPSRLVQSARVDSSSETCCICTSRFEEGVSRHHFTTHMDCHRQWVSRAWLVSHFKRLVEQSAAAANESASKRRKLTATQLDLDEDEEELEDGSESALGKGKLSATQLELDDEDMGEPPESAEQIAKISEDVSFAHVDYSDAKLSSFLSHGSKINDLATDLTLVCWVCLPTIKFKRVTNYIAHLTSVHELVPVFRCAAPGCDFVCVVFSDLEKHIRDAGHTQNHAQLCQVCNHHAQSPSDLIAHYDAVHLRSMCPISAPSPRFPSASVAAITTGAGNQSIRDTDVLSDRQICAICGIQFKGSRKAADYLEHCLTAHQACRREIYRPLTCRKCCFNARNAPAFLAHFEEVHSSDEVDVSAVKAIAERLHTSSPAKKKKKKSGSSGGRPPGLPRKLKTSPSATSAPSSSSNLLTSAAAAAARAQQQLQRMDSSSPAASAGAREASSWSRDGSSLNGSDCGVVATATPPPPQVYGVPRPSAASDHVNTSSAFSSSKAAALHPVACEGEMLRCLHVAVPEDYPLLPPSAFRSPTAKSPASFDLPRLSSSGRVVKRKRPLFDE